MKMVRNDYLRGLIGVFSSAAFCAYNWSIIVFLWDLPSFLLEWSTLDIITYAAYQFMFALAGSLLVTAFIAILGLIFPAKYIRNNLAVSGTALVAAFAVNSIIYKERGSIIFWLATILSRSNLATSQIVISTWIAVLVILIAVLVILPICLVIATKSKMVDRAINRFINNLSVLVVPYVILSLLGILLIVFKHAL